MRKKMRIAVAAGGLFFGSVAVLGMHLGLLNARQEFGTYGQYNRVLRVIRETRQYEVLHSSLFRRLDWRNLGHLERFSVRLRDASGKVGSIEFTRGEPEMAVHDTRALQRIVDAKFSAAVDGPTGR